MKADIVIANTDLVNVYSGEQYFALHGEAVVYDRGKILAEVPPSVGGKVSELPIEVLSQGFDDIQEKAAELGTSLPNAHLRLTTLTTSSVLSYVSARMD